MVNWVKLISFWKLALTPAFPMKVLTYSFSSPQKQKQRDTATYYRPKHFKHWCVKLIWFDWILRTIIERLDFFWHGIFFSANAIVFGFRFYQGVDIKYAIYCVLLSTGNILLCSITLNLSDKKLKTIEERSFTFSKMTRPFSNDENFQYE